MCLVRDWLVSDVAENHQDIERHRCGHNVDTVHFVECPQDEYMNKQQQQQQSLQLRATNLVSNNNNNNNNDLWWCGQ